MVSVPFSNNGANKNFKKDFNNENAGLVPPQNIQAEDGIRDQPRSRGLGDVYKRQPSLPRVATVSVKTTFTLLAMKIFNYIFNNKT